MRFRVLVAFVLIGSVADASADVITVGAGKDYPVPSQAAANANSGDIIEIDAGEYAGDVATWTQDDLVIRGVGGRAHLRANGNSAGGKGTWVIQGDNTTVENIEFSEAAVPDHNGAGIRQEGSGLTVRNCYFHDNENGILAGTVSDSDILIESSEFADNGYGDGQTHNMYINHVRSFTLRYSYSHRAVAGHNVKTRALENYILYNRIADEDGSPSDSIDMPNGGRSYVIGNMIQQGQTDNGNIIRYGEEGLSNPDTDLYVVNNTFVNERSAGTFLFVAEGSTPAVVRNNIFSGAGATISGPADAAGNYEGDSPMLVDPANYDYHLIEGSPCIDTGVTPGTGAGYDLTPTHEYVHPLDSIVRPLVATIDIGAFELGTPANTPDAAPIPDANPDAPDAGSVPDATSSVDATGSSGDDVGGGCCSARTTGVSDLGGHLLLLVLVWALAFTRRRFPTP